MTELKPCPFCGGEVKVDGGPDKSIFCIRCRTFNFFDNDTERMIRKWNTRHYPPEVQQAVERMKPKKITYDDSSLGKPGVPEFWIAYCPECNQPIDFNDTPFEFCRRCGQRLDWSE